MDVHLTLYVAGAGAVRSMTAKRRLDQLVDELGDDVHVDVVDVLEQPDQAEAGAVVATPMLVRHHPKPEQRVIGDLTDLSSVARALGLARRFGARSEGAS